MCQCVKDKTASPILAGAPLFGTSLLRVIDTDGSDEYRFGSEDGYHQFSFSSPEPDGSKASAAL